MDTITNYVDLCRKIDTIEKHLLQIDEDLEVWREENKLLFTVMNSQEIFHTTQVRNIQNLQNKKSRLQKMHDFYLEIKSEKENKTSMLKGLNYQISRMKYKENKSYKQIADELNWHIQY
ncbi:MULTISPECIES: hypothetical protein [Bacillaceae]|uniref:hypothetical protein n=1 Tax=Bacillaceae TaxID=186817 RepID=UPI0006F3F90C|nr:MULTISPECIES: hypothetical protein [Bacillaceae]KQL34092.1 hypothetical protein AN959_13785 [Psychrobacillus sp. FJAT-21963]MDF2067868.1 hypothetical protein [Bacillus sp. Cr_A10]